MINFLGIASIVVFYLLILAVGMWAARKNTGADGDQEVRGDKKIMGPIKGVKALHSAHFKSFFDNYTRYYTCPNLHLRRQSR